MTRLPFSLFLSLVFMTASHGSEAVFDYKHSKVEIQVKATGHDFSGALTKYHAEAELDDALTPISGVLTWDFRDLDTGNQSRDKKMLDWLSPSLTQASFTFEKWLKDAQGRTSVQGTMKIHGVEQKLAFPVTLRQSNGEITATGDAVVDHTHFQLPIITFLKFFKVNPQVRVSFVVKGTLK